MLEVAVQTNHKKKDWRPPVESLIWSRCLERVRDSRWFVSGFICFKKRFNSFSKTFSIKNCIYGAGYNESHQNKWQLLNFISGEAKMVIYISRGNKIEGKRVCEAASVWRCNARLRQTEMSWAFIEVDNIDL